MTCLFPSFSLPQAFIFHSRFNSGTSRRFHQPPLKKRTCVSLLSSYNAVFSLSLSYFPPLPLSLSPSSFWLSPRLVRHALRTPWRLLPSFLFPHLRDHTFLFSGKCASSLSEKFIFFSLKLILSSLQNFLLHGASKKNLSVVTATQTCQPLSRKNHFFLLFFFCAIPSRFNAVFFSLGVSSLAWEIAPTNTHSAQN